MTRSTLGTELMSVFQFPGQKARKTAPDFRALALGAVKALVSIALIAFLAWFFFGPTATSVPPVPPSRWMTALCG